MPHRNMNITSWKVEVLRRFPGAKFFKNAGGTTQAYAARRPGEPTTEVGRFHEDAPGATVIAPAEPPTWTGLLSPLLVAEVKP